MYGTHKTGIVAAKQQLFENAIYCLTPVRENTETEVSFIKDVLKDTKSNFIILNPDEHDEMTSVVSHFPHLVASSLVHQADRKSTRLNSSHVAISYAVFCLKQKTK